MALIFSQPRQFVIDALRNATLTASQDLRRIDEAPTNLAFFVLPFDCSIDEVVSSAFNQYGIRQIDILASTDLGETYSTVYSATTGSVTPDFASVDTGTDVITFASAHGLTVDDRVQFCTYGNPEADVPDGLTPGALYYVTSTPSTTTATLSLTQGGGNVDITAGVVDPVRLKNFNGGTASFIPDPEVEFAKDTYIRIRYIHNGCPTVDPQCEVIFQEI